MTIAEMDTGVSMKSCIESLRTEKQIDAEVYEQMMRILQERDQNSRRLSKSRPPQPEAKERKRRGRVTERIAPAAAPAADPLRAVVAGKTPNEIFNSALTKYFAGDYEGLICWWNIQHYHHLKSASAMSNFFVSFLGIALHIDWEWYRIRSISHLVRQNEMIINTTSQVAVPEFKHAFIGALSCLYARRSSQTPKQAAYLFSFVQYVNAQRLRSWTKSLSEWSEAQILCVSFALSLAAQSLRDLLSLSTVTAVVVAPLLAEDVISNLTACVQSSLKVTPGDEMERSQLIQRKFNDVMVLQDALESRSQSVPQLSTPPLPATELPFANLPVSASCMFGSDSAPADTFRVAPLPSTLDSVPTPRAMEMEIEDWPSEPLKVPSETNIRVSSKDVLHIGSAKDAPLDVAEAPKPLIANDIPIPPIRDADCGDIATRATSIINDLLGLSVHVKKPPQRPDVPLLRLSTESLGDKGKQSSRYSHILPVGTSKLPSPRTSPRALLAPIEATDGARGGTARKDATPRTDIKLRSIPAVVPPTVAPAPPAVPLPTTVPAAVVVAPPSSRAPQAKAPNPPLLTGSSETPVPAPATVGAVPRDQVPSGVCGSWTAASLSRRRRDKTGDRGYSAIEDNIATITQTLAAKSTPNRNTAPRVRRKTAPAALPNALNPEDKLFEELNMEIQTQIGRGSRLCVNEERQSAVSAPDPAEKTTAKVPRGPPPNTTRCKEAFKELAKEPTKETPKNRKRRVQPQKQDRGRARGEPVIEEYRLQCSDAGFKAWEKLFSEDLSD